MENERGETTSHQYPATWSIDCLANIVQINPDTLGTATPRDYQFKYVDIASVDMGVVDWKTVQILEFAAAPSRARRLLRQNDILLSTVRPALQAHTFVDWEDELPFVCSTGFAVLRANGSIEPRYLYQLIFHDIIASQLRRLETGSNYPAVNESDVGSLIVGFPHIDEQRAIADILDTIDAAIQHAERVIAKQKAIRAGLLHDLLTYGLDANGEPRDPVAHREQFKDSPLGLIPREWEVTTLGNCAESITSGSRGWARFYSDEGALFLRIGNLTREHINLRFDDVVFVQPQKVSEGKRTRVQEGDILVSVTADLGIIGVIPPGFGEAYVNQHIALVRLTPNHVKPRWIGHYLASETGQKQFYKLNDSGAKAGMNLPTVASLIIPIPQNDYEQKQIVKVIDELDETLIREGLNRDKLIAKKKGLMDDLLTGRVRVGAVRLDEVLERES